MLHVGRRWLALHVTEQLAGEIFWLELWWKGL